MMIPMMIGFSGASSTAAVLVAGEYTAPANDSGLTGYQNGGIGSLTPSITLGASTVNDLLNSWSWDGVTYTYQAAVVFTSASNPGATLWTNLSVGGNVKTSASATYSYVGTSATWTWTSDSFAMTAPNAYDVIFT